MQPARSVGHAAKDRWEDDVCKATRRIGRIRACSTRRATSSPTRISASHRRTSSAPSSRFSATSPRTAGSLVINGDLFEFWFEWRTVIPRRGFRTLAALADVVDAGVPVVMIAGNHDCWGGDVLRRRRRRRLPVRTVARRDRRLAHAHRARRRTAPARGPAVSLAAPRAPKSARDPLVSLAASGPRDAARRRTVRTRAARYAARDGGRGLRDAATRAGDGRSVSSS